MLAKVCPTFPNAEKDTFVVVVVQPVVAAPPSNVHHLELPPTPRVKRVRDAEPPPRARH